MYAVGRLRSCITRGVYTVSGPFQPSGGAVDIVVVEQQDGSFKSSPWYVRFGKFQGVMKAKEKFVRINVNGVDAGFHIYLDHKGEAHFLREVHAEENVPETYPLSSGDEEDGKLGIRLDEKSKSCNFDSHREDLVSPKEASNGKMLAITASNKSKFFGLVLGRKSIKRNSIVLEGSADMGRENSLEHAEIAANLLEVKWSTNLASSRRQKGDASKISGPNVFFGEPNDASLRSPKKLGSQELDGMMGETDAQVPSSPSPLNYLESFTSEETYMEVNFIPEGPQSLDKASNTNQDNDENIIVDKSENSIPVPTISSTMELNGNAEKSCNTDEQSNQVTFSHGRSISKVGSSFDRVESFMYYETVESMSEGEGVPIETANESLAFMASENGEFHVLPLDNLESIQQKYDIASEQVSSVQVIDTVEILENEGCSESLDGSSRSVGEKTPIPSVTVEGEVATELSSDHHNIVDGGAAMGVNPMEEVKEVYSNEGVYCIKPSIVLKAEIATELSSSDQNTVDEGPLKAIIPMEELEEVSSDERTNWNKNSATLGSDIDSNSTINEIRLDDPCTKSNQLSDENIVNDFPGKSFTSNAKQFDRDLHEAVIESSEDLLFQFGDNDNSYFLESNGKEVDESDPVDSVSQHTEGESSEEDHHNSHLVPAEILEGRSSPINISEVNVESDEGSLNQVDESLPSMPSHVYDIYSHNVNPAPSHSLDSSLENLMLIKDVSLPLESDNKEAQLTINENTTVEELKIIVSDPAVGLSLCRHLLLEGMGHEAASRAFEAEKLDADKFASLFPCVLKDDKLVVRIGGLYFPWEAALPIASAIGSSGSEQILEPKGMIAVDRVDKARERDMQKSVDSKNASSRFWPFSFQKSNSIKSRKLDLEIPSESTTGLVMDTDSHRVTVKNTRATTPTSEQLASLNLKEGKNVVTFTFSTTMLGEQQVDARIYLWNWNTKIVISDVDGTITKSDVLGQFMPLMGIDWSQTGVAHLFSAIKKNGYQLLFLSARAISQAYHTRQFLFNLKQDGKALPEGPVVISPDGLFPSLYREVIRRAPHEFKIACLEDIKALFPPDSNPFYAGFGNRVTDEISYCKVGIPKGKIFIINPKGEIAVNRRVDTESYMSLHTLVHDMFPPAASDEKEDFNSWNHWRLPPPSFDV